MDYIYDIVLNFQDEYYDFYEWHPSDKIVNIAKIPIYKISSKTYLNIKNNNVTIVRNTLPKQNNNGKVIKKSSLLFDESDEILEDKEHIKKINLKYIVNKINNIEYISRIAKEKNKYLEDYFNKIDIIKDEYFLKYLYYDISNNTEKDINKVYANLLALAKNNPTKMCNSIKKIELELKK